MFIPADKGKVMVAMDKRMEKGGENSYEYKMKTVLEDMKAKPSIRANKDWDLTEKISKEGREIVNEMVMNGEITEGYGKRLKPNDCRAPRLTGYPKIHKPGVPLRGVIVHRITIRKRFKSVSTNPTEPSRNKWTLHKEWTPAKRNRERLDYRRR